MMGLGTERVYTKANAIMRTLEKKSPPITAVPLQHTEFKYVGNLMLMHRSFAIVKSFPRDVTGPSTAPLDSPAI
jgi:hypothetical protein